MTDVAPPHTGRLTTPVRSFMQLGVIAVPEDATLLDAKRALVRHGVHAVLILGTESGHPLGWVTADGLLAWLERDLAAIPAAHAITEPPHTLEADATAHDAIEALRAPGVSHLLVSPRPARPPLGVVAPMDLVDLMTRP